MMKVLFISVRSDTGGGPKHVYDLATTLMSSYPSLNLTIASPMSPPYGEKFKSLANNFIEIPHRSFSFISFFKLLTFCRESGVQIVHSHGRGAGIYSRLLNLFGLKVVHTFHGAHLERTPIGMTKLYIDRIFTSLTDHFINVSQDEHSATLNLNIATSFKSKVILNGIGFNSIKKDFDALSKESCLKEFNLNLKRPIWGTLSRLTYQKGLDLFLKYDLPKEIDFIIAGEGEDDALLKKIVADNNITNVHFVGNTSKPIHFLKTLNGYFSSSRWEGMPLSVLEAMSCEIPCILSNVDGHRELKGITLYNSSDKKALKVAINKIDLLKEGQAAAEAIRNNHSLKNMARETFEIYSHL